MTKPTLRAEILEEIKSIINCRCSNIYIEVPEEGMAEMVFEDEGGNKNRLKIVGEYEHNAEIAIEVERKQERKTNMPKQDTTPIKQLKELARVHKQELWEQMPQFVEYLHYCIGYYESLEESSVSESIRENS